MHLPTPAGGASRPRSTQKPPRRRPRPRRLELKRLASTQLLLSGHTEDGLAVLRTLLGPLGMSMPGTAPSSAAVAHLASISSQAAGLKFQKRNLEPDQGDGDHRIDLCWSAVAGLSMSEPIRGADFQIRGLLSGSSGWRTARIARASSPWRPATGRRPGPPAAPRVAALLSPGRTDRRGNRISLTPGA